MAVIFAARRTAVCPRGGAFARLRIEDLAAPVMQAVLADAGIAAARVDEVILANALGAGGNPARRAALLAGLPERVAGLTIDRQCAGGLDAILLAQAMVDSSRLDPARQRGMRQQQHGKAIRPARYREPKPGGWIRTLGPDRRVVGLKTPGQRRSGRVLNCISLRRG